ncbi:NADH pyrophosphatase [Corynebacterium ulcerans]|nr:NAD(+) diphosphatase [Corynebacterium ulcerans]AIT88587.1 NADH pyrophosphatase [Corynebacterium ulcerans]ALD94357.1 NADH pyrophosphatase [Corynebacterium ulcerans]SQG57908.1 NADH pyrophosphatase [Corynebacterium ulcerans]
MFQIKKCLLVDPGGRVPVHKGNPVLSSPRPDISAFNVTDQLLVQRVAPDVVDSITGTATRSHIPWVTTAIAVLRNREVMVYDPASGERLEYNTPTVGRTPDGKDVFPRIDPAVIGLITSESDEYVLLGENTHRRGYFSLIAGYLGMGETFEQALTREVWEETGRRISHISYVKSQSWPYSGAIMVGMTARTTDMDAVVQPDGELTEIRWVTRKDIVRGTIQLPAPGSIAHDMMWDWVNKNDD